MPHLAWLGIESPRGDKILDSAEARALLGRDVSVEEKLDGANLGLSLDEGGGLRAQNRGQVLTAPYRGQFSRLDSWLAAHEAALIPALAEGLILFGEWCAARHSLTYDRLPDWFMAFDIYDRRAERFWAVSRRNDWTESVGVSRTARLNSGQVTLSELTDLVKREISCFGKGPLEGVVVRADGSQFLDLCAKLVRPAFTQSIEGHWRGRLIEWNTLAAA